MDYDGDKVDKGYSTANIVKREPDDYKLLNENPGHKHTGRPWIGALVQLHTLFPPYTKRRPLARTSLSILSLFTSTNSYLLTPWRSGFPSSTMNSSTR